MARRADAPEEKPPRRYFGTDGIRGRANTEPITPQRVLALALASGKHFRRGDHRHRVVIGKDTRLSGYMLEPALTAGFIAMGVDVLLVGPMPTPAVAWLTPSLRADAGVMISASHNLYHDNGIKLFGPDGSKLSDEDEGAIEALMEGGAGDLALSDTLGRARRLDDAPGRYIEFVKGTFPSNLRLDGLKIVVDCAHGATYRIAPLILEELGAEVLPLGVAPDGFNINARCGATAPASMVEAVLEHGADCGIALDGDGDRIQMCTGKGRLLDGDGIMALLASDMAAQGLLGDVVVGTVMSNMALARHIESLGARLVRAQVGDRYVASAMQSHGCVLGGESSGHVVLGGLGETGDGLLVALRVLSCVLRFGGSLEEATTGFEPVPQYHESFAIEAGYRMEDDKALCAAMRGVERDLADKGRMVVRPSGTEPVLRVMVECEDEGCARGALATIRSCF